ncbi:hypothetical protein [Sphingobium sp. CCH11-B1]|uniref:hypothetical protein n=1 Tax=Sphingobium sp. CCH11-B1 TaxID=1768781 RepID=UPI0012E3B23D|nr:hypothetical protein [Sphingobium sp. CCH11-B1]
MEAIDPMMSQNSVSHASFRDEGQDIRQRLAQHLAETNSWVAHLQARFLAADPASGGSIELQAIEDAFAERRGDIERLHEEIEQHKRRSEQLQFALDDAISARAEVDIQVARLQPLAEHVALIESQLRQREEEMHQAYAELKRQQDDAEQQKRNAEALEGDIEKLRAKLSQADKWIFRLAGERRDSEQSLAVSQSKLVRAEKVAATEQAQARRLADALARHERDLVAQSHEIDRLSKALDEARSKLDAASRHEEGQHTSYATDIYPLNLEIRRLADGKRLAEHQRWLAEQETQRLGQEVNLLTRLLYETREKAEKSEAERSSLLAESEKVAVLTKDLQAAHETQEKLAVLLAELRASGEELERKSAEHEKERKAAVANLEQEATARLFMARISEVLMQRHPFWWNLTPKEWRSRRTYAALRRRGIFDAEKYCDMYPDVPAAGMDPLEHYIKHGMYEGRSCPL